VQNLGDAAKKKHFQIRVVVE